MAGGVHGGHHQLLHRGLHVLPHRLLRGQGLRRPHRARPHRPRLPPRVVLHQEHLQQSQKGSQI